MISRRSLRWRFLVVLVLIRLFLSMVALLGWQGGGTSLTQRRRGGQRRRREAGQLLGDFPCQPPLNLGFGRLDAVGPSVEVPGGPVEEVAGLEEFGDIEQLLEVGVRDTAQQMTTGVGIEADP